MRVTARQLASLREASGPECLETSKLTPMSSFLRRVSTFHLGHLQEYPSVNFHKISKMYNEFRHFNLKMTIQKIQKLNL